MEGNQEGETNYRIEEINIDNQEPVCQHSEDKNLGKENLIADKGEYFNISINDSNEIKRVTILKQEQNEDEEPNILKIIDEQIINNPVSASPIISMKENQIRDQLCLPEDEINKENIIDDQTLDQPILEENNDVYFYYDKYSCIRKEDRLVNKKKNLLQEEAISNLGEFNFKKNYSRLEKEKIELERNRLLNKIQHSDKMLSNESQKSLSVSTKLNHIDSLNNNFGSFMSDAKIHKSKLEQIQEVAKENKLIGAKRENDLNEISGANYSVKKQKTNFEEDWSTLMSNSIKKKPQVQLEKEKFLEECKKRREESLKNKNILAKSQVMKFDIPGTDSEDGVYHEEKALQEIQSLGHSKICVICEGPVEHNFKKLAKKCDHVAHMKCWVKLKITQKSNCYACSQEKQN